MTEPRDLHNPDGWTFAALIRHLDALRIDDQRAIAAALSAAEKAVSKAEAAQEKRNETFNEFRALSNDRDKNFAGVGETNQRFANIETRLGEARDALTAMRGKTAGVNYVLAGGAALLSAMGTAVGMWLALKP